MVEYILKLKLEPGVEPPEFKSEEASCFDLAVNKILKVYKGDVEETVKLDKIKESFLKQGYLKMRPFERIVFGTGIFPEIPSQCEVEVRPRSGAASKKGVIISNSPGTIDSDYIGEIGVIITNNTPFLNTIKVGDRLAQAKIVEKTPFKIEIVDSINKETERGDKGFGSSGI